MRVSKNRRLREESLTSYVKAAKIRLEQAIKDECEYDGLDPVYGDVVEPGDLLFKYGRDGHFAIRPKYWEVNINKVGGLDLYWLCQEAQTRTDFQDARDMLTDCIEHAEIDCEVKVVIDSRATPEDSELVFAV